jgi:hypothetical protein
MAQIRETGFLNVRADLSFPEKKIVINPNDGFDLGLMMTDTTVSIRYGQSPATISDDQEASSVYGNVYQRNECTLGTIEMSSRVVESLGSPKKVRLHLIEGDSYPTLLVNAE